MKNDSNRTNRFQRGIGTPALVGVVAVAAVVAVGAAAMLTNIFERKQEAKATTTRLVEVTQDTTDPAKWGVNWPKQYDSYLLTAQTRARASAATVAARPCRRRRSTATRG